MRKKEEDKNIIEIKEETQIGDVILEKGDKVEVLNLKERASFNTATSEYLRYLMSTIGPEQAGMTFLEIVWDIAMEKMEDEELGNFILGLSRALDKIQRLGWE